LPVLPNNKTGLSYQGSFNYFRIGGLKAPRLSGFKFLPREVINIQSDQTLPVHLYRTGRCPNHTAILKATMPIVARSSPCPRVSVRPSSSRCVSGASKPPINDSETSCVIQQPLALVRAFRLTVAESEKPVKFSRSVRFTARISTVLIV
jgi:hypothetical protein